MATEYIRNVARIVTVAVCILCCLTVNDVSGSDAEERLRYDLFHNYNATVRPAEKPGDTVVIDIALAITQILDVDEKRQVVTGNLWIYQIWTDFRLKWDPADYDGIFNLPVQSKQIWFPDTALYQSANEEHVNYPTVIAPNIIGIIDSNGSITVCTAHIYELPCVMAITRFPFDKQSCPIYFGTWVHYVHDLDFRAYFDKMERESFIANTEWEIADSEAHRYEGEFLTFPGKYAYMEYILHIERKPMYYIINLSIPCVLFSILTVLVFYLPPDSSDKIPLAVSILLTLFVFNLLVADIMPASSDGMPMLSLYLLVSMALVVMAVILSAVVMKIHSTSGEVHGWTKKIFIDFLPRYVFFNVSPKKTYSRNVTRTNGSAYERTVPNIGRPYENHVPDGRHESEIPMISLDSEHVYKTEGIDLVTVQNDMLAIKVVNKLDQIIEELRKQNAKKQTSNIDEDWKMVAKVLNRLFCIIFFAAFLGFTVCANEEHVNYPTVIALNIIGIIHNDGSVTVCTAHVYELPCVMAITTFPFDTQTCPVYFGTWVHFVQDLDFKAHFDGVERESFIANTEWEITGSEANRYEGSFLTFAGNYSYLEFLIHIERKPMYYIINLSIPCVLFSILTVLVFYLPPDSADKIPLAVSILLTLFVFNLLVADIMPASSDGMPILSLYLLMSMALVVLAVIFSAFVMKIHAATGEVHGWTRKIFIDFLPRYLFFNLPTGSKERQRVPSYEPNYVHMPGFTPRIQKQRSSDSRHEADNSMKSKDTDVFIQEGCDAAKVQHYIISTHVLKRLDMIIEELKQATNDTDGESDWKMVANVLNRLLLIVFFILFLACTMWLVT